MIKFNWRGLAATLALTVLAVLGAKPARAWKPYTHIYLATQALKDATADGYVTIYKVDYANGRLLMQNNQPVVLGTYRVRQDILQALRNHPENFWAGCMGPDVYPDIAAGQTVIHPPTLGGSPDDNPGGNPDGTGAWLAHLWRSVHDPAWKTDQNLAFVLGYFAHGAGDIYGHTYINSHTGGIFQLQPNPENALRHIVLEGYLAERTPALLGDTTLPMEEGSSVWSGIKATLSVTDTGDNAPNIFNVVHNTGINGCQEFLYENLINPAYSGVLRGLMSGKNKKFSVPYLFLQIRDGLVGWRANYVNTKAAYDDEYNAKIAEANAWGDKAHNTSLLDSDYYKFRGYQGIALLEAGDIETEKGAYVATHAAQDTYAEHWIGDIDDGLREWLAVSHDLGHSMMFNTDGDTGFAEASSRLERFAVDKVPSMLGTPDLLADAISFVGDLDLDFNDAIRELKDHIKDTLCEWAFGKSMAELKRYFLGSHVTLVPLFTATLPQANLTLTTLNKQMGIVDDPDYQKPEERFDWRQFPAAYNTVTLIKMSFMEPGEVQRMLRDLGNTDSTLAFADQWQGTPNNIMLGWIPSFDGSNQFAPHFTAYQGTINAPLYIPNSPGMILARSARLYQQVFMKVVGGATGSADPNATVAAIPTAPLITNWPAASPVIYLGRGEEMDLTTAGPSSWSLDRDTGGVLTATQTPATGTAPILAGVRLIAADHIPVSQTFTLTARDRNLTGYQQSLIVITLPDMIVSPSNVDVYAGRQIKFTSNAAQPSWVLLASSVEIPNAFSADGTMTAPTTPGYYAVRCVETADPGTTSVLTYVRVHVRPLPPPFTVENAANIRLKPGEKVRLRVTPDTPVTWKIVGDTGGAAFGTLQAPEAASAKSDRDSVVSGLKPITTRIVSAKGLSLRAKPTAPAVSTAPVRVNLSARAPGAAPIAGGGVRTGAIARSGIRMSAVKSFRPPTVAIRSSVVTDPKTFARGAALPEAKFTTAVATPALLTAQKDRLDYLKANETRLANATKIIEDTLATVTSPAQTIKDRIITVQAEATDGSGRTATAKITLLAGGFPTANPGNKPLTPPTVTPPTATPNLNPPTGQPNQPNQPDTPALPIPTGDPQEPSKNATFGIPYRYDESRFAVTVLKAEYSITPFSWGKANVDPFLIYCNPKQKFLKLTLHVRNLGKEEREFGYQSVVVSAVGGDGGVSEPTQSWKRVDNGGYAKLVMPPGKELTVQGVVVLSAEGPASKLTIGESEYPLGGGKNLVAPLPREYAADGVTVLPEAPAKRGVAYPGNRLETTLLSAGFSNEKFPERDPEPGKAFYVVTMRVKNRSVEETEIHYQTHYLFLYDTEDDKYEAYVPFKEKATEKVTAPLRPLGTDGDERVIRYYFEVPKGRKFKRLTFNEFDSRTYVYGAADLP